MPRLSVILVNYNERDYLSRVLEKLRPEFPSETEIIVVDNASRDGSADFVRQSFPDVRLIEPGANLMYGKGNNLGMEHARGDWLLVMNPDVDWEPGRLRKFVDIAQSKGATLGVAGPKIINPDGSLQRSAHCAWPSYRSLFVDYCLPLQQIFLRTKAHPYLLSADEHNQTRPVAHVTGVCLFLARKTFIESGGIDPAFTMYLEETEWQQRISGLGLQNWFVAEASITHYGSVQKSFAQASRHYLWGWWYYSERRWAGTTRQVRLLATLWLADLISLACLLPLWPLSFFLGRIGKRWRFFTRQYVRLTGNLLTYPTRPPTKS